MPRHFFASATCHLLMEHIARTFTRWGPMRCAAGVWGLALILLSAAGTLALESSELRECLEPLGTLVDASEPELLKSAVLLENLLFSNSTPVAVLYPSTTQAVEGAVKCARAAGVKVSVR